MSEAPKSIDLLPIAFEMDNATVYLLELSKLATGGYLASVKVKWEGIETRVFQIHFNTRDEFKHKLSAEISKLKMMALAFDKNFAMRTVI